MIAGSLCDSTANGRWACSNLAALSFKESGTKRCVLVLSYNSRISGALVERQRWSCLALTTPRGRFVPYGLLLVLDVSVTPLAFPFPLLRQHPFCFFPTLPVALICPPGPLLQLHDVDVPSPLGVWGAPHPLPSPLPTPHPPRT